MLLRIVMVAPVQARLVLAVAVPGLGDVNLAVLGPREGLLGEEPEGRPDAGGAGGLDQAGEDAAVVLQCLLAD